MSNIKKDIKEMDVLKEGNEKSINTYAGKNKEKYGNCLNIGGTKGNKIKEEKIIIRNLKSKNYKTIIKLFLMINIFIQIPSSNSQQSYITLKIEGSGEKRVFCCYSESFKESYYPGEIYINNKRKNNVACSYNFDDIEGGNTVKLIWNNPIKNCEHMFNYCYDIKEIDLSHFDSSRVTNTNSMFYGCSITSLDLSNFDTSLVENMEYMFASCYSLTSLDLSHFITSKVSNMSYMFSWSSSLSSIKFDNFITSKVKDMRNMFSGCSSMSSFDLSKFDTSSVENMDNMFSNCSVDYLDLSKLDTSKVTSMNNMFSWCNKLTSIIFPKNTSKVTSINYMFSSCSSLTSIDLSKLDTSKVTSMNGLFSSCISLTSINFNNFNTFSVESMNYMFSGCILITSIDLSKLDISKVTSMNGLFLSCISMTSLDLSKLVTSSVRDISYMFSGCSSLTSLDLSKLDTSKVTNMRGIFQSCSSLTSLNLSNFETSLVQYMDYMFYGCSLLTSLDLSNFDTSQVIMMYYMFYNCSSLTSLDLSNFNTSKVTYMLSLFDGCINLEHINIINFSLDSIYASLASYSIQNIFNNVPDNIVICINKEKNIDLILPEIEKIKCHVIDCSDNWLSKQKKIEYETGECTDNCDYEYNGKCYQSCPSGKIFQGNKCKCELNKCNVCPNVALANELCTQCSEGFYPMENDPLNLGEYFNCYNGIRGYYLDTINFMYKKCDSSCEKCSLKDLCTQCANGYYPMEDDPSNEGNNFKCYKEIQGYYLDNSILKKCNFTCDTCSMKDLCTQCANGYYRMENDPSTTGNNFKCYNGIQGYYLDNSIYKKCDSSCETCLIKNLCTKCINDYYPMENDISDTGNNFKCYNGIHGYYLDSDNSIFKKCNSSCETCSMKDLCTQCANGYYRMESDSSDIENNFKCYNRAHGYYLDYNDSIFKKCNDTCETCEIKELCSQCINGYYPMENDLLNSGDYFKCYNDIHGYYLDSDNSIFKKCNNTCETCEIKELCSQCVNGYYRMENDPLNSGDYFKCYNAIHGYYLDHNDSLFKKCNNTCETCEIKELCSQCVNGYFPMENDPLNSGDYFKCYNEIHGYYLDHDDSIFKKCNSTCETCEIKELCSQCVNGYYPMENDPSNSGNYFKCYKAIHGYYLDHNDSIFKKCNHTCETCEIQELCSQCINDYYPKENDPLNSGNYFKCYNDIHGYYLDHIDSLFKKCNNTCETCEIKELCSQCVNGYYPMENDPLNSRDYFNCYNTIHGYYLDHNDSIFKKCYHTCETCEIKGNGLEHNCLECNLLFNYSMKIKGNNYSNCLNLSTYITKYEFETFEDSNYTVEEANKKIYEQIIDLFIQNFDDFKEEEKIIESKNNFFYHLTTLENELNSIDGKNNNSNKFSKIDLGECEDILKEEYDIDKNLSLLMLKYERLSNKSSERNLQFEIYNPIDKTRLNLSVCENVSVDVYVPLEISENLKGLYSELKDLGYNLFDINSNFYQDICTPYKTSNGTDILLSDRLDHFFNNGETQCQPNCEFSAYSVESQNLKCECDAKSSEINFEKNNDDKNNNKICSKAIYKSFFDVLKFSNYKVLKCFKLAFSPSIFKNNKGNIIVLSLFGIYSTFMIINFIKGATLLKKEIFENIINKKQIENKNEKSGKSNINHDSKYKTNSKPMNDKNNIQSKKNKIYKNIDYNRLMLGKPIKKKKPRVKIIFDFPPKKNLNYKNNIKIFNNELSNIDKDTIPHPKKNVLDFSNKEDNEMTNTQKKISKVILPTTNEEKEKLDNYELNNLEYDEALKLDKRNFLEMYWSILKREHLIIFTLFYRNDHNIEFVKYSRFIFFICTDMALNVFFFSDETMHKMFLDYGKYNFIQQIPQIVYSTIVSQLIEILLCFLSLTDKHFYQIKV